MIQFSSGTKWKKVFRFNETKLQITKNIVYLVERAKVEIDNNDKLPCIKRLRLLPDNP